MKHGSGQTNRAVSHLARHVLTQESDAEAMARWLRSLDKHGKVLELGTSLGLTAMHFVRSGWDVETWEGCPNTIAWARSGWQSLGVEGCVRSRVGTFQSMLEDLEENAWTWCSWMATTKAKPRVTWWTHLPRVSGKRWWWMTSPGARHARAWMAVQDSEDWRVSVVWRARHPVEGPAHGKAACKLGIRGRGICTLSAHSKQQTMKIWMTGAMLLAAV